MPINNAGQYTYGVPQNNGYYSSGYGSMGNPYIVGGPGYTGAMNNIGGSILPTGGLLSNSAKVQSNPGFDDTDGTPIHYSPSGDKSASWYRNEYGDANAAREAAIAGDMHTAYVLDHLRWRQENDISDFDLFNTKYPGNVELGIPSDKQKMDNYFGAKQLAGAMIPGASLLGIENYYDGGEFQTWQDMQNTPLPGVMQNQTPMITPIWNGQTSFNANKQSTPAQVTAPVANAFNPYAGYEAAPAPATANNEDGYGGYANADAHAAAQSVMEEKVSPDEYWYI